MEGPIETKPGLKASCYLVVGRVERTETVECRFDPNLRKSLVHHEAEPAKVKDVRVKI